VDHPEIVSLTGPRGLHSQTWRSYVKLCKTNGISTVSRTIILLFLTSTIRFNIKLDNTDCEV